MSLSEPVRLANNLELLVRHAIQEPGAVIHNEFDCLFNPGGGPTFDEIVPTTWEEVKRRAYIENQVS